MKSEKRPALGASTKNTVTMPVADEVIAGLRASGNRITKVRRAVVELLSAANQPLSAIQVLDHLESKRLKVNKTTVYRELDFLLNQQIVSAIDLLDGAKRYELIPPDHHHHHLVCTECGKIQCVEMEHDLDALESSIKRSHSFKVESHVLEFFGRCSTCL